MYFTSSITASLSTNPLQFDWLKSIDILDLIVKVFCICMILFLIYEFGEKITNKFGFSTARQREKQQYNEMLEKTNKEIREMVGMIEGLKDDLNDTSKSLSNITSELALLKDKQAETDRKNIESKKVTYKDRLYQSYRYYKNRAEEAGKKEWTKIEADGFWSMFNDYESYGGNGYVHDTVEPYMREFLIIKIDDKLL